MKIMETRPVKKMQMISTQTSWTQKQAQVCLSTRFSFRSNKLTNDHRQKCFIQGVVTWAKSNHMFWYNHGPWCLDLDLQHIRRSNFYWVRPSFARGKGTVQDPLRVRESTQPQNARLTSFQRLREFILTLERAYVNTLLSAIRRILIPQRTATS